MAQGEHVAIIGRSGAGKSTLLRLLAGLLTPNFGMILCGGRKIADHLVDYREIISFVPQSPTILDGTIRENVIFGWDDGHRSAVVHALEAAQLSAVVASLPDGIDSQVGELGTRLSGGQQQRLALARALYRRPDILILDEPTSALDAQTEREFLAAVHAIPSDITVIVVSHRQDLIDSFDRVLEMVEGTIVDHGRQAVKSSA